MLTFSAVVNRGLYAPDMVQLFYKAECKAVGFIREHFKEDGGSLFIVGGDGTYLKALSKYGRGTVPPVYAFNTGTVGALMPFSCSKVFTLAEKISQKVLPFATRRRLYVSSHNICVANDLIIYSKAHGLGRFHVYINGEHLQINGDGLTIATMCGSTGHNFSIGGPVLMTEGIILNCSAPNRCNFRPLVLPSNTKIRVETSGCVGLFDNCCSVECDVFEIEEGDSYAVAHDEAFEPLAAVKKQFSLG